MSESDIEKFHQAVWAYYEANGRHDLPWRIPEPDGSFDPYKILVSEMMLQQTQVKRVIPVYHKLIYRFPTVTDLAQTSLSEVLQMWSGLGYNRRAKFLHQAAKMIVNEFDGHFPKSVEELVKLPGVGPNTAAAVAVYSFNMPLVFIETNIRTVFIHHFFKDKTGVSDKEILTLVESTLDQNNPRIWFWALMDYGSFLKKTVGNLNTLSKHYVKQSPLEGSRRQIRGQVLRLLTQRPCSTAQLQSSISDSRLTEVLQQLVAEHLITRRGDRYHLG